MFFLSHSLKKFAFFSTIFLQISHFALQSFGKFHVSSQFFWRIFQFLLEPSLNFKFFTWFFVKICFLNDPLIKSVFSQQSFCETSFFFLSNKSCNFFPNLLTNLNFLPIFWWILHSFPQFYNEICILWAKNWWKLHFISNPVSKFVFSQQSFDKIDIFSAIFWQN